MPSNNQDKRSLLTKIKDNVAAWVTAGFMVLGTAGGTYLVDSNINSSNLNFVDVGWWNIRDFSTSSRDSDEIAKIAEILEGTDVMAIGELNDTLALAELTEELGPSWCWAATKKKIGRSGHSSEFYGFIWDTEKADLIGSVNVYEDPNDDFDREPSWATFKTTQGDMDFTLICVHVTWGKRVGPRKEEVKAMKDVWLAIQEETPNDDDLIVVGDFNRNKNCKSFNSILSISGMERANEDTGPTHISSKTTYDQIFISKDFTKEWTGEFVTLRFDEIFFDNNDAQAKLIASDHRPVWIRLHTNQPDLD